MYLKQFHLTLKETEQLLFLTESNRGAVHAKLNAMAEDGVNEVQFLRETLTIINDRYQNTTYAVYGKTDLLSSLPLQFYREPLLCQGYIQLLKLNLKNLDTLFVDIRDNSRSHHISPSKVQSLRQDLKEKMLIYTEKKNQVLDCLKEYKDQLYAAVEWGKSVTLEVNKSAESYKLDLGSVDDIAKEVATQSNIVMNQMSL